MKATNLLRRIPSIKNSRQARMLRGQFEGIMMKAVSIPLVDSALREWDRQMKAAHPAGLPY